MSRIDRTVTNAFASYARFGVSVAVVFFITPLFIRVLGADSFGLWSLVFALVGVVGLLDFGLLTTTTKYVAESKGRRDVRRRPTSANRACASRRIPAVYLAASPGRGVGRASTDRSGVAQRRRLD